LKIIVSLPFVLMGMGLGFPNAWATSPPEIPSDSSLARASESNAWLEIDVAAFTHNLRQLKSELGGRSRICAVLKADAYGHGISLVTPAVIEQAIPCVAVASNEELRAVRESGYSGRLIRVRMATAAEIESAIGYDVEELIGNLDLARSAAGIAERHGRTLKIHLALNSGGMSRNGIDLSVPKGLSDVHAIASLPTLSIAGIMTHFPVENRDDVAAGLQRFQADVDSVILETGLDRSKITVHSANSFATLEVPESRLDMVRPGGLLFGDGPAGHPEYRRVMRFKSRVAAVNAYSAGNTVGYDRTFTLQRASLIANVPAGYSDGYPAAFGNRAHVLIRGQRAPVIGRVSMNTMTIDVTDIDGVRGGDEVVLFGEQGTQQITQSELEAIHGSLLADLYTIWGSSNPRIAR
jgi:alanine racemase